MIYPVQPQLIIANRVFTQSEIERFLDNTTGIILYSSNATASRGTSFRTASGTAYQVGVGETLTVKAMRSGNQASSGVTPSKTFLAYSDAAVAFDTASPGTNPIYFGSGSSTANVAASSLYETILNWEVPASKYPFFSSTGNEGWCQIFCFID